RGEQLVGALAGSAGVQHADAVERGLGGFVQQGRVALQVRLRLPGIRPAQITSPIRFGSAISPFITSENVHTTDSSVVAPMNTTMENTIRYGVTARMPINRSMQRSP